ncbi:MAG: hypothetical protein HYT65_00175 [Candidatus Yanofskybacteria bacterium]|nr:hypothetical protein [Candidatus Yanofskybacteria bacterium]
MEEPNLTQNQQPPEPPVQPENPFIKSNFTPKFVAVIVGLLIIGGTAYGYATYLAKKNFNEVSRLAAEGKKQEDELKQRRIEDSLATVGWQTYRNEKYGFEFRYPANLMLEETSQATFNSKVNLKVELHEPNITNGFYIEMNLEAIGIENCDIPESQEKIINGTNMVRENCGGIITYQFDKESNSFFAFLNSGLYDVQIFDRILSTFKFIEKNEVCIQVITPARNPQTGEAKDFPTPCDVPDGWEVIK